MNLYAPWFFSSLAADADLKEAKSRESSKKLSALVESSEKEISEFQGRFDKTFKDSVSAENFEMSELSAMAKKLDEMIKDRSTTIQQREETIRFAQRNIEEIARNMEHFEWLTDEAKKYHRGNANDGKLLSSILEKISNHESEKHILKMKISQMMNKPKIQPVKKFSNDGDPRLNQTLHLNQRPSAQSTPAVMSTLKSLVDTEKVNKLMLDSRTHQIQDSPIQKQPSPYDSPFWKSPEYNNLEGNMFKTPQQASPQVLKSRSQRRLVEDYDMARGNQHTPIKSGPFAKPNIATPGLQEMGIMRLDDLVPPRGQITVETPKTPTKEAENGQAGDNFGSRELNSSFFNFDMGSANFPSFNFGSNDNNTGFKGFNF